MLSYALRRLIGAIPTLFIIVTVAFFLIRVAPGGPFHLERPLDPQVMENLMRVYDLDEPLWRQYLLYLGNLLQGDLVEIPHPVFPVLRLPAASSILTRVVGRAWSLIEYLVIPSRDPERKTCRLHGGALRVDPLDGGSAHVP